MRNNSADRIKPTHTMPHVCELPGFTLYDSRFDERLTIPAHTHDEPHLTFVLTGGCEETYLGKKQSLSALHATWFHPGETHALQIIQPPFRAFDMSFNPDWLKRFSVCAIAPDTLWLRQNAVLTPLLSQLYREFSTMDEMSPLALEGLALTILAELSRASRPTSSKAAPSWLRAVVERIHDEYDQSLTLTDLAATAGVHPSHLTEVFRTHRRCTPGEYQRRLRIERATQLMSLPDQSLADIALAVGFSDQSHFTRFFKRATGLPPAQFRRLKDQ